MTDRGTLEWDGAPSPNVPPGFYSEAIFTRPRVDCPHPEHWNTYDAQGTEVEVIEMVHGLIRGLQPRTVLETGTSRGYMASAIAAALEANGHGHLWTYEPDDATYIEACRTVLDTASNRDRPVSLVHRESMMEWGNGQIDFAWFDSLLTLRWDEFNFYHPFMTERTVVGFHDTATHFGGWASKVRADTRLDIIDLPTPRGVILGRVRRA